MEPEIVPVVDKTTKDETVALCKELEESNALERKKSESQSKAPEQKKPEPQRNAPEDKEPGQQSYSREIPCILLLGKTGSGKSSLIRTLQGNDEKGNEPGVSDGIHSCTRIQKSYRANFQGRQIILIDTPGFDDSIEGDLGILEKLVKNLHQIALEPDTTKLHGVIYMHDISETRFGESQRKNWQLLKDLCGEDAMRNVLVGTTMWSENANVLRKQAERERSISQEYWEGIHATKKVREGDEDCAALIINELLAKDPVTLLVQREMMQSPIIAYTTAGRRVIEQAQMTLQQFAPGVVFDVHEPVDAMAGKQTVVNQFELETRLGYHERSNVIDRIIVRMRELHREPNIQSLVISVNAVWSIMEIARRAIKIVSLGNQNPVVSLQPGPPMVMVAIQVVVWLNICCSE